MDLAATFIDYAGGEKPHGMTSKSLKPFLEGQNDYSYREYVSSGLQARPWGEKQDKKGGYNWRMVIDSASSMKFICCKVKCFGPPSTAGQVDGTGYQQLLYDTVRDPFDMTPVQDQYPDMV